MPSIDDVFGGTTLKSSDIKGKNPTVTIDRAEPKSFKDKDGSEKTKLIVSFVGAKKSLVCNVTNARRIAHLYGDDYGTWAGKKVKLQVDMVDFGGQVMDGIRVYPPGDKIETGRQKPPMDDMEGDSIPF